MIYGIYSLIINAPEDRRWRIMLYIPLYVVIKEVLLRPIRIWAMFSEFILHTATKDPFVPKKVQNALKDTKN